MTHKTMNKQYVLICIGNTSKSPFSAKRLNFGGIGFRVRRQKACYHFNGVVESLNTEFEKEKSLLTVYKHVLCSSLPPVFYTLILL